MLFLQVFEAFIHGLFSATKTLNSQNHSHAHYSLSKFTLEWFTTILAEIITKQFRGAIIFVIIFVIVTKIILPEHFLCNVAATGDPCCERTCEGTSFVKNLFGNFYKISCAKTILFEKFFCSNFGRDDNHFQSHSQIHSNHANSGH